MIGIEGQYLFDLQVGSKRNFLTAPDLERFELIEQAGNLLPTFKAVFTTADPDLARYLNEGQTLGFQYGKDRNNLQDARLAITESRATGLPDGKRRYTLEGFSNKLGYINSQVMRTTPNVSALEAMQLIAKRYFQLRFDTSHSSDSQVWIQPSTTDRRFIQELWLHANLPGSFPMVAITAFDDAFICRDARKHFATSPKWRFTPNPKASNEFSYDSGSEIRSASGFFNMLAGYPRNHIDLNREDGRVESTPLETETFLALASSPNRRKGIKSAIGSYAPWTPNTHEAYHTAYANNVHHLAIFSSFRILGLPIRNQWIPVQPLDLALYRDDVTVDDRPRSDEHSSGLYVVSKVHRVFNAQQHATFIDLSREAPGGIVGDLA